MEKIRCVFDGHHVSISFMNSMVETAAKKADKWGGRWPANEVGKLKRILQKCLNDN